MYELLFEWGGSYVRLLFEKPDLLHETYGKLSALESAKKQQAQENGAKA